MKKLTDKIFVDGQIREEDLAEIKAAGVTTIINNRPDGEGMMQPKSADLAAAAKALGIDFVDIPIAGGFPPEYINQMAEIVADTDKTILAFCRTGTRSTLLWALSQAADGDIDTILKTAQNAGYDFGGYRQMLESMKR